MTLEHKDYTAREGDTYRSVAEANGIWDWWDLVEFNRHVNPDTGVHDPSYENPDASDPHLANPDLLEEGDKLRLPDFGPALTEAQEQLQARGPQAERFFTGEGFLSVWGTLSFTIQTDAGQARFEEGAPFRFRDIDGDVIAFYDVRSGKYQEQGTLDAHGGFEVDVPRARYDLEVQPQGGAWRRVTAITEETIERRRAALPLPSSWNEDHQRLVREQGVGSAFPDQTGGGFDVFSLAGLE